MFNKTKRGKVWIAAAGLVIEDGKWLLVKKKYGGLKGKWSIPAGFVDEGETLDAAAVREVYEETGIIAEAVSVLGVRTGVLNEEISDNMVIFLLKKTGGSLKAAAEEIEDAVFMTEEEMRSSPDASLMIHFFLGEKTGDLHSELDPGSIFGYTSYKLFDTR
ncbi:NUDIX domain-containing protein [Fictibacillus aquaticus]|uniref:NUDIX hydrolase n=1 Tax=Fictibacillus aquaticus TaxID=2021314 RepID=A0A235F5G2_9BACL|nr:NUDIX domain-containing protein [Fictibacillus aquaticus]OYD56157.1 NUDIX hydrolase [Fictibacillus aquaticus]